QELKALFKEALIEILTEKREIFREIFEEALEDFALWKAIEQGRKNSFVPEKKIIDLLEK
ncbi:MAG: hypothetical protein D6707_07545, partial [Bacteroidetes bacterium]